MAGLEDVVIGGGAEMMSSYAANSDPTTRSAFPDSGNLHLRDLHPQVHQGLAADAIATLDGIPRAALDELAVESQRRAEVAIKEGRFDRSVVPVLHDDGTVALDREEYPRPGTTVESLAASAAVVRRARRLPARRRRHHLPPGVAAPYPGLEVDHVHHAGNSSGVVDGAAAVLLASPSTRRPRAHATSRGSSPPPTSATIRR